MLFQNLTKINDFSAFHKNDDFSIFSQNWLFFKNWQKSVKSPKFSWIEKKNYFWLNSVKIRRKKSSTLSKSSFWPKLENYYIWRKEKIIKFWKIINFGHWKIIIFVKSRKIVNFCQMLKCYHFCKNFEKSFYWKITIFVKYGKIINFGWNLNDHHNSTFFVEFWNCQNLKNH